MTNSDWHANIDKHLEDESKNREQRIEVWNKAVDAIPNTISTLREGLIDMHRHYKLKKHSEKFRCSICREPSTRPGKKADGYHTEPATHEFGSPRQVTDYTDDWSVPSDMNRCSRCRNWVCFKESCSHKGICKNCGQKLSAKK